MSGVPGAGGPPPKRSDQRRRANTPAAGEPTHAPGAEDVVAPDPDPEWHPIASRWFVSLGESGQSTFYEPSDWATAAFLAESMSRELKPQPVVSKEGDVTMVTFPPKAASMAAWLKGATALMATEGDRRRLAVELQRGPVVDEEAGHVEHLTDARLRLAGAG